MAGTRKTPASATPPAHPNFWDVPLPELLRKLQATPQGLSREEAEQRLHQYGPNSLVRETRFALLGELLRLFTNPLVAILIIASIISYALGDHTSAVIIIAIVVMSIIMNFYQEYQANHAVEALRKQVATTAAVIRDGQEQEFPVSALVPGDIIRLNAGDLVPADCRLLEEKDLHVREAALTGESLPVEKEAHDLTGGSHSLNDADNSVFLGTAVQTGIATAVVVHTGTKTAYGAIAARLAARAPETEFDRGIRQFGLLVTRIILLLVLFVFLFNLFFKIVPDFFTAYHLQQLTAALKADLLNRLLQAFLFAVALAVGLTPELLPVIISVTLAQGAKRMARKKVIVKQLAAIENFGSMEILCSDKTGTLTEGEIVLDKHVDVQGNECESVLQQIYVNSYFESGIKSPLDDAILKHDHPKIDEYSKVDEIPFDFNRRRLSVVVQHGDERLLITKGEVESIFDICTSVTSGDTTVPFDAAQRQVAENTFKRLSSDGYRCLGVAVRTMPVKATYSVDDEQDMTLTGFAAFLDPPKPGILQVLHSLNDEGISVIVMTGDNQYVTQKIAKDVGLPADNIITGNAMDGMDDAALAYQAEHGAIFARVSPEQKNRVITALKAHGRVVGYLGDGINDAPSLHAADIGISVVNGVDVAKDAASIILLEKDLNVLQDGVLEGRRSFANIMKYIIMGTSSNFGNMFSMAAASVFLPFLPMLPTQILLNNFLYDASQLAIPTDNVDPELLQRPKRWKIDFIRNFMLVIGPISSIYDFLTFAILLWGFHAFTRPELFHTGWFVESLATQTLVVFVIRTAGNPFSSRPSPQLLTTVLVIVVLSFMLPYTHFGKLVGFVPLNPYLILAIIALTITYLLLVQVVKTWFYRKNSLL